MASKMMGKNITEVIHATAKGLHNAGVTNEQTMWKFDAMWCSPESCVAGDVVSQVKKSGAQYVILPENPAVLSAVLDGLGSPERLYRDPYFSVYRVE